MCVIVVFLSKDRRSNVQQRNGELEKRGTHWRIGVIYNQNPLFHLQHPSTLLGPKTPNGPELYRHIWVITPRKGVSHGRFINEPTRIRCPSATHQDALTQAIPTKTPFSQGLQAMFPCSRLPRVSPAQSEQSMAPPSEKYWP